MSEKKKVFTNNTVGESKQELREKGLDEVKRLVELDCWVSLKRYFSGAGNGAEARMGLGAAKVLTTERQAKNNSRQLDLVEKRLALTDGKL